LFQSYGLGQWSWSFKFKFNISISPSIHLGKRVPFGLSEVQLTYIINAPLGGS